MGVRIQFILPLDCKQRNSEITAAKNTSRKSISVTVSSKLPTPGPSNSSTCSHKSIAYRSNPHSFLPFIGLHSISSPSVEVKPDPEARFNVIIRGPGPDQEAEFKTRGKHLVKKVLAGACKTFQLDFAKYVPPNNKIAYVGICV